MIICFVNDLPNWILRNENKSWACYTFISGSSNITFCFIKEEDHLNKINLQLFTLSGIIFSDSSKSMKKKYSLLLYLEAMTKSVKI